MPHPVRHLKTTIDKSKQTARQDRLTWQEFERLLVYFERKPALQAYLMFAFESLGRPQEILWRKIKDLEIRDNYAIVKLTDHGKEGIGLLQCIDSYSYLMAWYNMHPFRNDLNVFLFLNEQGEQLTPVVINKHLRQACKKLGINKPVTCYSIKRNGVSFRRLRGDSDLEIQRAARWTSTKQLKAYDFTDQEDAIKLELMKRGMLASQPGYEHLLPKTKTCVFCKAPNKFTDATCHNCNRPLDRKKIEELEQEKTRKAQEMEQRLRVMEQAITQLSQNLTTPMSLKIENTPATVSTSGLNWNGQFMPNNNWTQCAQCKQHYNASVQHFCKSCL